MSLISCSMDRADVTAQWLKTKKPPTAPPRPPFGDAQESDRQLCLVRPSLDADFVTHQWVWHLQKHEACQSIHIAIILSKISMLFARRWKCAVDCETNS
ncbi:hypothetical protein ACO2I3_21015 [Leptospira interrogans]